MKVLSKARHSGALCQSHRDITSEHDVMFSRVKSYCAVSKHTLKPWHVSSVMCGRNC